MRWFLVASLLTVFTSSQGILTTLSQTNGKYIYDYATVPFLAEVFKLLVSSFLLWRECKRSPAPKMTTDWRSVRLFPIPSVIYLIHNNVQFATLMYVDTSTYQIMGNLKIVTTGILFRFSSSPFCYVEIRGLVGSRSEEGSNDQLNRVTIAEEGGEIKKGEEVRVRVREEIGDFYFKSQETVGGARGKNDMDKSADVGEGDSVQVDTARRDQEMIVGGHVRSKSAREEEKTVSFLGRDEPLME